jgi:hypothetical protein
MGDGAFENLLVTNAAYIKSLTSKQVVITDDVSGQDVVVAGMTSGTVANTDLSGTTTGNVRI